MMEYLKTSMASQTTRAFIRDLIYDDILLARDASPNMNKVLNKIRNYEQKIREEIKSGSFEYFKSANIKSEDAYDSPFAIGTYKAAYVWNSIYPDNQIALPGTATIVKIKAKKLKDLACIASKYPDIYEKFEELFEKEIVMIDRKTKEKKTQTLGAGGISAIAIPRDIEEIPEWIIDIIDMTEIIQANTKLLLPVLKALGIYGICNTRSSQFVGSIVDLD